jgi:hypothetical protein
MSQPNLFLPFTGSELQLVSQTLGAREILSGEPARHAANPNGGSSGCAPNFQGIAPPVLSTNVLKEIFAR